MADLKVQLKTVHENKERESYIADLTKSYSKVPTLWNVTPCILLHTLYNNIPCIKSNKIRSLISTYLEPQTSHIFLKLGL